MLGAIVMFHIGIVLGFIMSGILGINNVDSVETERDQWKAKYNKLLKKMYG